MYHRSRVTAALVAAVLLLATAPATSLAADATQPDATVATTTPLDTNLLRNSGFESVRADGSLRGWTTVGDVHAETFGTRAWPYPAYGKKYHGGDRYLTCGKGSGFVRQTIELVGRADRNPHVKARLQTNFGGTTGHRIRISLRVTGSSPDATASKYKVMDVTNHYKMSVTSVPLPLGAQRVEATLELLPKPGASSCRMVADTVLLTLMRV